MALRAYSESVYNKGDVMKKELYFVPILTLIFVLTGCATAPQLIKNEAYDYKISRVFNSDFERNWATIIKVMEAHPITTIEKDSGILLTDWVQGASPLYLRKLLVSFKSVRMMAD